MENIDSILRLHDTGKLSDKEAIKRIKSINKQLAEHALDPDILAGVPEENNHLQRHRLTHWRHG